MDTMKNIQLGKNGLTDSFIESLRNYFKNNKNVKISVLRSGTRNREELKEISEKILEALGNNYTAKIIGFTIAIKQWRKPVR